MRSCAFLIIAAPPALCVQKSARSTRDTCSSRPPFLRCGCKAYGVRTQLYTEQKKFKAKMNYADKTGVPYVVFLGEDEVKNNVIACKDMTSGEQTTLNFAATLARIRDGLAERNKGKVIVEK